jgi:cytochrome c oxidase subunit 2
VTEGIPLRRLIAAVFVLTAVISVVMLQFRWNGEQGSTARHDIDTLLDVMIVLSSFVFSIVLVMLGYSLYKWRAKPGDESDGAPIHGNTRLEIAWTVIPTIIVLFGAGYSWAVLHKIEERHNPMIVDVIGQQYEWHFDYPEQHVTSHELHVPVNRQIEFHVRTLDVIHSFWVPEWGIKKDAVPGQDDTAIVTPDRVANYTLVCTELCGIGHATMRAPVVVEPSMAAFQEWASKQEPLRERLPSDTPDTNGPNTP